MGGKGSGGQSSLSGTPSHELHAHSVAQRVFSCPMQGRLFTLFYRQEQLSPSKPSEQELSTTTEKGAKKVTNSSDNDEDDYCANNKVVLVESSEGGLPFGGSKRVVGKKGNLTWGEDVVRPIRCVSQSA